MANGDGFSEVGGGGSVKWEVSVKDGDTPSTTVDTGNPRKYSVRGRDKHSKPDGDTSKNYFKVEIERPRNEPILDDSNGNKVVLYLPIDRDSNGHQIRVSWAVPEAEVPRGLNTLADRY